jgi:hypothetical protein
MLCKYRFTNDGQILQEEDFREILGIFFKEDTVIMAAEPNDEMVDILWRAINESRRASKAFGFVPRPTGSPPGATYIAGIMLRSARELSRDSTYRRRIEIAVLSTTTARLRSDMYLVAVSASEGIVCNN